MMNQQSMQLRYTIFALILWFCMTGVALADKQVLLSFDINGHTVDRILDTAAARSFRQGKPDDQSQHNQEKIIPDPQIAVKELQSGTAGIIWLDRQGYQISVTISADPRISRSPGHIISATETLSSVESGAWLVKAPDKAAYLIVMLAAAPSVSLQEEVWELSLLDANP